MVWPVLNPDIHAAVIEFTKTRSHRVMAVIGGAIIEEALLRALDHMRIVEKGTRDAVFFRLFRAIPDVRQLLLSGGADWNY